MLKQILKSIKVPNNTLKRYFYSVSYKFSKNDVEIFLQGDFNRDLYNELKEEKDKILYESYYLSISKYHVFTIQSNKVKIDITLIE